MVTDQDIARFLRDALPQLIAVYRFGSTASAQEHAESDLDIAVLAGDPIDAVARFELQERLAAAVGRDVDLVDLRRASTVMAMQVISTGRIGSMSWRFHITRGLGRVGGRVPDRPMTLRARRARHGQGCRGPAQRP